LLVAKLASGGMASVYLGKLAGPNGFSRVVAIKRLHRQLAEETHFVSRFMDEARLSAQIRHPNVVPTLDVVRWGDELLLVLEFIEGVTLNELLVELEEAGARVPLPIVSAILSQALLGLHAAHTAVGTDGQPLEVVHRDFSPQNLLVGSDGLARVLDFGIAKAASHLHASQSGQLRGKLAYMAPEQVHLAPLDPRTDVFSAGVVLWETLTGRRLFTRGDSEPAAVLNNVSSQRIVPPSELRPEIPTALDAVVLKALDRVVERRFQSANEFALALEQAVPPATPREVGAFVTSAASALLRERAALVKRAHHVDGMVPEPAPARRPSLSVMVGASLAVTALALGVGLGFNFDRGEARADEPASKTAPTKPNSTEPSQTEPGSTDTAPARSAAAHLEDPSQVRKAASDAERRAPSDLEGQDTPASVTGEPRATTNTPAAPRPATSVARSKPASARSTARKSASASPVASKPNCNPPTYEGSDGIRHFKKECL
jgi:serine/threonine-protein kinase